MSGFKQASWVLSFFLTLTVWQENAVAQKRNPTSKVSSWFRCASENAVCSFSGTRQVRYGFNGKYAFRIATGSIGCNNTVFGDPNYGADKYCDYSSVTQSQPQPQPAPAPAPAPVPAPAPAPLPAPAPSPVVSRTEALLLATPNLSVQAGGSVTLRTRFNAVPMAKEHFVFIHFINSAGEKTSFNGDYIPTLSTTRWSGFVQYDRVLTIPANTPAGSYKVMMGLFENAEPWTNRATLTAGPGVTADLTQLRYTVGTLNVTAGTAPAPMPAPTPAPTVPSAVGPRGQNAANYVLTFSDEFENGFDRAKWNDTTWDKPQGSAVRNYAVENGSLKIWPQQDADGSFPARVIDTDGKFYQTYGYFEIEAKLPIGRGVWPAFWLYNHDQENTNFRPEIDIMEAYPGGGPGSGWSEANLHPTAYAPTIWTGNPGVLGGTKMVMDLGDLSAAHHTYALKWEPGRQTFYFDGREVYTVAVTMPNRMYVMLDILYGSASGQPNVAETPQGRGNAFDIKYIRVWRFK